MLSNVFYESIIQDLIEIRENWMMKYAFSKRFPISPLRSIEQKLVQMHKCALDKLRAEGNE